jgi:hypothetical protein
MAEKKIGSKTYRCEKLPASESFSLLLRLGQQLGPGLGKLATVMGSGASEAAALAAIGDVLAAADPTKTTALLSELIGHAEVAVSGRYEACVLDHHFDGDLVGAFSVAMFVVKANYQDFFGELLRLKSLS